MTHDYAKRSRAVKRPAARKNTNPPPPKRPLWPALIVVLLVAGLGFGLYQLAGVEPDPQATQQAVQQPEAVAKPVVKTVVKTKAQPKQSKPDYKFYKLLPESEVTPSEVEAYKSTPKSAADYSKYLLQAGSFKRSSDADSLRATLLLVGMPNVTTSKVVSSSGTTWYRVRLGPFSSRSKLNKAYDQLVRMRLQPLQIKL
jgi:cell division protein FtsN